MPKLSESAIERRKDKIEYAARELFITQEFHATSMHDIAKGAGVSLGNVYNYYETKDALFESIVAKYLEVIDERLRNAALHRGTIGTGKPPQSGRDGRQVG